MNDQIVPILIEKDSVSDSAYLVTELKFLNGDQVMAGDVVMMVESSKTSMEVYAPVSGYLFYNVEEGHEIPVGEVCAAVSPTTGLPENYFRALKVLSASPLENGGATRTDTSVHVSSAAQKLMRENGLELDHFPGMSRIRTDDVLVYINAHAVEPGERSDDRGDIGNQLIIIGAGGHAKMCIDLIRQMGVYQILGIVAKNQEKGAQIMGIPVIGRDEDLESIYRQGIRLAVIGLAALQNPVKRMDIYKKLKSTGFILPNIVHPFSMIEPSAKLGEGNQIMAGAIIGSDVRIGSNCIVNSGAIISHESVLQNNVHVTPGAILAGGVRLGNNVIIGMGATIYLQVKIGDNAVVPNGTNVTHDIPNAPSSGSKG